MRYALVDCNGVVTLYGSLAGARAGGFHDMRGGWRIYRLTLEEQEG